MINQYIVDILVNRILTGGINPSTGKIIVLDDILIEEYKAEVERTLANQ